ncbi:Uncharacterised protein [Mycobacteroides abscessus subsp. abscessus]|nr:Uncharacterised protein [Mycobacteroides abscessus subsp. abscessus]
MNATAFCTVGFARRAHSSVGVRSVIIRRARTVAAGYACEAPARSHRISFVQQSSARTSPPRRSSNNTD